MRLYIISLSFVFIFLALGVIFAQVILPQLDGAAGIPDASKNLVSAAVWSLAIGGLGAVASIFLHVLRMLPQETLRITDEFEVIGRIILGCLFSLIFAVTLIANDIVKFFGSLHGTSGEVLSGAMLLLPFLAGYSIPLVLGLLQKAIRAVELTLALDDRRTLASHSARRRPTSSS